MDSRAREAEENRLWELLGMVRRSEGQCPLEDRQKDFDSCIEQLRILRPDMHAKGKLKDSMGRE